MRHAPRILKLLAIPAIALLAAACGNASTKSAEPAAFRGIYTASGDCADSGKFTFDECVSAMEKAVAEHEKTAPTYTSMRSCENTEGIERCERTHLGNFRPILLAFLMTASKPPVAKPLYGLDDTKPGFRTAANEQFLILDEALAVSPHAQTLAEASAAIKGKPRPKTF